MTEENSPKGLSTKSIKVSVFGKETDKVLADALRQLLQKPTDEAGSLIGDWIGIFGDKIRRKRKLNINLGMGAVRKKLAFGNVDMKDITPPREEELYLLMSGLSLTDDNDIREMWAGLFAKALEPNSDVTVERSFISVLESLSPTDAKIIHFLAYANRELEAVAKKEKHGISMFWGDHDPQVAAEIQRRSKVVDDIEEQADVLSFPSLKGGHLTDNLLRQGIIEVETKHASYWQDVEFASREDAALEKAINEINEKFRDIEKAASTKIAIPEELYRVTRYAGGGADFQFQFQLSSFGRRLAEACGLI